MFQTPPPPAQRDLLTIVISISAFLISLLGYFQKKTESREGLRKQLTDLLKELSDQNLKIATFRGLSEEKKSEFPSNYTGLINDHRRVVVRQAAYISDRLKHRVNSYELTLIAGAFDGIDFVEDAERFFKRAVRQSLVGIDKGIAIRNYARFLFGQGLYDKARNLYEKAQISFSGDDDRMRFYKADTFIRWAEQEYQLTEGGSHRANHLLDDATKQIAHFRLANRQQDFAQRIRKAREAINDSSSI